MKIVYIISLFILSSYSLLAQVEIDNNIDFSSNDSTRNQVLNHSSPLEFNHAVNADAAQNNYINHSNSYTLADGVISLDLSIPSSVTYSPGMMVSFVSNFVSGDSISITINGGDTSLITKQNQIPLDTNDIRFSQVVRLVYDGTNFVMLNTNRGCPPGFVQVNNSYCIQEYETGPMTIYEAMSYCDVFGAQLCSMSDWYNACKNSNLGLNDMTNNWEWTNHGNDHSSDAASMGGNGICEDIQTHKSELWQFGNTTHFRCCYYK